MRYPVDSWDKWYSAQRFGVKTDYGFHEAEDINLKTGGNSDCGQPIYAIATGEVTAVHDHKGGFGKHIHIHHYGPWGTVWCHYAHCGKIEVSVGDTVEEGKKVGEVGSTGNSKLCHLHWAIKLQPTGIDGIAKTKTDLDKWTAPIAFVEKWMRPEAGKTIHYFVPGDENEDPSLLRETRDKNWNSFQAAQSSLRETKTKLRENESRVENYENFVNDIYNELSPENRDFPVIVSRARFLSDSFRDYQKLKVDFANLSDSKERVETLLKGCEGRVSDLEAREKAFHEEVDTKKIKKGGSLWQKFLKALDRIGQVFTKR